MRDPFVQAAPLVVAMSCSDGIAMVAAHSTDEPLLYNTDHVTGRIQTAGEAVVIPVGWRADGNALVEVAREFVQDDEDLFGEQSNHLPIQVSEFMAQWIVSGRRRWSCASIVALDQTLWLVDATGAYPVLAQCLGGGMKRSGEEVTLVSECVHDALLEWKRAAKSPNHFGMTAEQGLTKLTALLSDKQLVSSETKLELAILDRSKKLMRKRTTSVAE